MPILHSILWAKAHFLQIINCHGLKPVAVESKLQGTSVPNTKLPFAWKFLMSDFHC